MTTSVKRIFSTQRLRHTHSQANAAGLSNVSLLASLKTDGIKVLIASLPANCPSASILSGSIISSFLLAHVETSPSLVAVPFRSRQSNPTLRQKQRAVPPHWCWRRRLRCISWHHHTQPPNPITSAPLPPPETLEIHKRPGSGEGPAKLGVVTLPDSQGVTAATDKHSRGDLPTSMDGLAVEVRGSNGAFYKVTRLQT